MNPDQSAVLAARIDRLPVWPYRRAVFFIVGATFFFAYFDINNVGFALPRVIADLHTSKAAAATVLSAGLWGYIVGGLINAVVSDRLGRKAGLLTGVLLYGIGSVGTAVVSDMTAFSLSRLISGMGIGATISVISTYISEISPSSRRGRYMSWATFPAMVGAAVVPFVSLALVPTLSWGWRVMMVLPVIGAVVFAAGYRILPESPRWLASTGRSEAAERVVAEAEELVRAQIGELPPVPPPAAEPVGRGRKGNLADIFRRPVLRWTALLFVVWVIEYVATYGFVGLGLTLLTEHGFDLKHSIQMTLGSGAGLVLGSLITPYIADKFPRKYIGAAALLIAAAALSAIAISPTGPVIGICYFLVQFKVGSTASQMYLLTAEHFPTSCRTAGVSVCNGAGHVGGAVAPFVFLAVFDAWGFNAVWLVMAGLYLVVASLVFFTRNTTGVSLENVAEREPVRS